MTFDPILGLMSLGYTEREAAFLYLVAVHSGYFVRRQFDYFTDRNKGALVMRYLTKARHAGHLEVLDYQQGWHVYHVSARAIYRLLGDPESQNRRRKGDAQVRARLIALDYVLENDTDHYLESESERVRFFTLPWEYSILPGERTKDVRPPLSPDKPFCNRADSQLLAVTAALSSHWINSKTSSDKACPAALA
jgi:hypothetical protein